jgi:signal transduction histidine kinase
VVAHWNESISSYGGVRRFEARLRHKDGSWRWFDIIAKNLLHNPAVGGVVIVCRDASERVEIDRRLREYVADLEHEKSQISTGAAADEIRTPIGGMVGFAELLLETTLSGAQRECAERIRDSGSQVLRLLERD